MADYTKLKEKCLMLWPEFGLGNMLCGMLWQLNPKVDIIKNVACRIFVIKNAIKKM